MNNITIYIDSAEYNITAKDVKYSETRLIEQSTACV